MKSIAKLVLSSFFSFLGSLGIDSIHRTSTDRIEEMEDLQVTLLRLCQNKEFLDEFQTEIQKLKEAMDEVIINAHRFGINELQTANFKRLVGEAYYVIEREVLIPEYVREQWGRLLVIADFIEKQRYNQHAHA